MEKYSNRREVRRVGGRFAKAKTLEQLGFDVNQGGQVCTVCSQPNLSIIKSAVCVACRLKEGK